MRGAAWGVADCDEGPGAGGGTGVLGAAAGAAEDGAGMVDAAASVTAGGEGVGVGTRGCAVDSGTPLVSPSVNPRERSAAGVAAGAGDAGAVVGMEVDGIEEGMLVGTPLMGLTAGEGVEEGRLGPSDIGHPSGKALPKLAPDGT